jgi:hypothetical protein
MHDRVDAIDAPLSLGTPVAVGASAIAISEFGGAIVIELVVIFSTTSVAATHLDQSCNSCIADTAFVAVQ